MAERIPDSCRDPSHKDEQPEEHKEVLNLGNGVKDYVVKLRFLQTNGTAHGSGFYLNIPDVSHDVILTAGHNLIDKYGKLSENITVLGEQSEDDITVEDYHICRDYISNPQPSNAVNDYGIILLEKKTHPGFGFSLKLAFFDDLEGGVFVTGYRDQTKAGNPDESWGTCEWGTTQLVYKAHTEQGISGSPVWVAYEGHETVVAIHNHRPESKGKGSRGTRLNFKVLLRIFEWVNVGWLSKAVKVSDPKAHPAGDLYLQFSEYIEEGRVRVSADGSDVSARFDILPARSWPTAASKPASYVFMLKEPNEPVEKFGKWVRWDPSTTPQVRLVKELRESCLVKVEAQPQRKKRKPLRIIRITDTGLYEVLMAANGVTKSDVEDGINAETSEVSLGKHTKSSKAKVSSV